MPTPGADYAGNLINLDDYIQSPLFQDANEQSDCVIDIGSADHSPNPPGDIKRSNQEYNHLSCRNPDRVSYASGFPDKRCGVERKTPRSDYSANYNRRNVHKSSGESESSYTFQESAQSYGHNQCSLDSGVSEGFHHGRNRRPYYSNVDFHDQDRRTKRGHKLRNRRTYHDVSGRSQTNILNTLKLHQEELQRLAALCEKPKVQRQKTSSPDTSSSDLSSSISGDESSPRKVSQDKCKKLLPKVNKVKFYKKLIRQFDEANRHLVSKQVEMLSRSKSSSESKTVSESIIVSDKAVGTDTPKKSKSVSARNESRAKYQKPTCSVSSSSGGQTKIGPRKITPEENEGSDNKSTKNPRNREGYERLREEKPNSLDPAVAKKLLQIYTAFDKTDFDPLTSRSSRLNNAEAYGIHDYNLNDPMSFYNRSKRLGQTKPAPTETASGANLCSLCRIFWSRLRTCNLWKILCSVDGNSVHSHVR